MRYYISGPMTGYPDKNYAAFDRVRTKLMERGDYVFSPPHEEADGHTWVEYLKEDLKILATTDAIVMLDGWQQSRGARFELDVAQRLGLDIYDEELDPLDPKEHQTAVAEAAELVYGNRGADYGHPLDDFTKTAIMWSAITDTHIKPEHVPLMMIAVKISRELNKHKRDNIVDIAGYAETLGMVRDEQERRAALTSGCMGD